MFKMTFCPGSVLSGVILSGQCFVRHQFVRVKTGEENICIHKPVAEGIIPYKKDENIHMYLFTYCKTTTSDSTKLINRLYEHIYLLQTE
jgi:hypothetical protein